MRYRIMYLLCLLPLLPASVLVTTVSIGAPPTGPWQTSCAIASPSPSPSPGAVVEAMYTAYSQSTTCNNQTTSTSGVATLNTCGSTALGTRTGIPQGVFGVVVGLLWHVLLHGVVAVTLCCDCLAWALALL